MAKQGAESGLGGLYADLTAKMAKGDAAARAELLVYMNTMASACAEAGPTAALEPFLLAFYGIRAVQGGQQRDIIEGYQLRMRKFGLLGLGMVFAQKPRGGERVRPTHAHAYPPQYLDNKSCSAVRYGVQVDPNGSVLGRMYVPTFAVPLGKPEAQPIRSAYELAKLMRPAGSTSPTHSVDYADPLFEGEIAGWAVGTPPEVYGEALIKIGDARTALRRGFAHGLPAAE